MSMEKRYRYSTDSLLPAIKTAASAGQTIQILALDNAGSEPALVKQMDDTEACHCTAFLNAAGWGFISLHKIFVSHMWR